MGTGERIEETKNPNGIQNRKGSERANKTREETENKRK
jgi:hypothetical protein